MIRFGVDFGGAKIEAAAPDAEGRFVARVRKPNPGSYDEALTAIAPVRKARHGDGSRMRGAVWLWPQDA